MYYFIGTLGLYPGTTSPLELLTYILYSRGGLDIGGLEQADGHCGSSHDNRILVVVLLITLGCGRLSIFEKSGDKHMIANIIKILHLTFTYFWYYSFGVQECSYNDLHGNGCVPGLVVSKAVKPLICVICVGLPSN